MNEYYVPYKQTLEGALYCMNIARFHDTSVNVI